jgi:hypothetical protein
LAVDAEYVGPSGLNRCVVAFHDAAYPAASPDSVEWDSDVYAITLFGASIDLATQEAGAFDPSSLYAVEARLLPSIPGEFQYCVYAVQPVL